MEIKDWSVDHKSDDETKQFVKLEYKIVKGPTDGSWNEIFGLQKTQLWRLRNLLEALGFEIPSSKVSIPFEKLPGKKVAVEVIDDEYEGKTRSKAADYFKAKDYESLASEDDEEEDEDEDEDEDAATDAATDDDEDEDEDEELELVDDDEL
jgi:hypothetical protein